MTKKKYIIIGLLLTVVGAVLGSIIAESAVGAGIGAALGYVASALIGKYV